MIDRRSMHGRLIRDALRSSFVARLFKAFPACAATITVNTLADEFNANGNCSLREAPLAASRSAARCRARGSSAAS